MLEEDLPFGKLARKVVWENFNIDLKLLRYSIFQVFIQLSIAVKESELVWTLGLWLGFIFLRRSCLRRIDLRSRLSVLSWGWRHFQLVTDSNLLHEHQNFVNPGDVFLDFGDIVHQYGSLDTFSCFKPLHNASVLIPNIPLNHLLHRFYFIESVIKSNDLADELSSLWHQAILNLLVYCFKSEPEGFIDITYAR